MTLLSDQERAALREAATKATPGPRTVKDIHTHFSIWVGDKHIADVRGYWPSSVDIGHGTYGEGRANAILFRLSEPATVLRLLDSEEAALARAAAAEKQGEALRELVKHCWVHSGYENCGYRQMDSEQRKLYDRIISEPIE